MTESSFSGETGLHFGF